MASLTKILVEDALELLAVYTLSHRITPEQMIERYRQKLLEYGRRPADMERKICDSVYASPSQLA